MVFPQQARRGRVPEAALVQLEHTVGREQAQHSAQGVAMGANRRCQRTGIPGLLTKRVRHTPTPEVNGFAERIDRTIDILRA